MKYFLYSKEESSGFTEEKDPIEEAVKEVDKSFENKDEIKEEEVEEKEEKEEEEEKEEDLKEEELAQAKNLFKLLNNPETSKAAVEFLVKQAGLSLKEIETKEEKKEAIKSIKEQVADEFGENYKFLADAIGNILEKVLPKAIEDRTKAIKEAQDTLANEKLREQVQKAQDEVLGGYQEIPTKVLMEVLRIQEEGELAPGPKSDKAKFFKSCLVQAAENLNYTLVKKGASSSKTETKTVIRNPLNNLRGTGSDKEGVKNTQIKSFKDAIDLAVEEVEAKLAKT